MNGEIIKILLAVILFGFGSAQVSAQTCISAPIGLISSYSGDGNALDARSRYNGTIQNGVTFTTGKVGNAFNLAGNNGDRILLGNTPDLRRQNFTIESWVKRSSSSVVTNSPNPGSPAGVLFAFGQNGYALLIQQGTGKIGLSQVGQSQVLTPNFTITDTNWHHIAVTVSGPPFTGGSQTIFYLDGVADTPTNYSPQYNFSTNAAIGSRGDGQTDNIFFGLIDELAIYDRPLSAAQIAAIYAADTAGKCKPLATSSPNDQVLWLAGDGDAVDFSGNGNNGTLQNGTVFAVGKVGQGFTFDGTDDQITIPDNVNQNGGTNLTIEAWINPSSLPHGGTILQKRTSGNIGGYVFEPTQPSGGGAPNGLQFVIMIGGVYSTLNPANVLNPNVWQHVSATYDGAFMRIYVNGVEVANKPQAGSIDTVAAPIVVGRNIVNLIGFPGKIDEISVYNRALSAEEIQSVSNAGIAGKYKTQATVPSDIAAWYPADGNTNDLQAANNGTLQGGATYGIGKVGQAFSLNGTNAYVSAPSTAANDPTGAANGVTMEAWIYLNQLPSAAGRNFYIMSKSGAGTTDDLAIFVGTDNGLKSLWGGSVSGAGNALQTGQWYHVAVVYTPTDQILRYYFNGVFAATQFAGNPRTPSGEPLTIGRDTSPAGNTLFNGLIDEPAIYNRALSEAEIRDQYHAGNLGKYKGASNPTASNTTKTGEATVTFGSLTTGGAVNLTPIDANLFPVLPMGINTGLNFDISTSAVYTSPTVCLNVPSFTPAQFTNLRIYHLESGVWQNRTAVANTYPNLCTSGLTSLSPFAVAFAPSTAANSAISGRVIAGKNGLSNVNVTLSGGNLQQPLSVKTNSFGNYKFENLPTGTTYILTVSAKKYTFATPMKTVNLNDEVTDADFVAENP